MYNTRRQHTKPLCGDMMNKRTADNDRWLTSATQSLWRRSLSSLLMHDTQA